tara:strand:+ start:787 stop:1080 length:294 start_codon:yes stop_codon:yes gene_type:complete
MGDEYMVDASIDITTYSAPEVVTATSLGLSRINRAVITRIGGGQQQHSFNLVGGPDTKNNLYLEVNVEDNTSGKEAEHATNDALSGVPVIVRVYGLI